MSYNESEQPLKLRNMHVGFRPRGASEEGQQETEAAPHQGDTQTPHDIPRKVEETRATLKGLKNAGAVIPIVPPVWLLK